MDFGYPNVLLGLWILPALGWLLIYAQRKRLSAAGRFVDPAMAQCLMPSLSGPRPWIKAALVLAALCSLIVAGARPRFGTKEEEVTRRGADLFVLLDVSRSMDAEDVAPSRLERAKLDIRDLLQELPGDRVGLIVFAGKPTVKVPLTTDQGFFRMTLAEINTQSAPRGGSMIGDAIRKGIEAMPERRNRDQAMVLITDGEDHESYPVEAARQAARRGIKIFTVGLGDSREGARVPVRDLSSAQQQDGSPNGQGRLRYLKYKDQEHWSKLDEGLMKEIARTTNADYFSALEKDWPGKLCQECLAKLAHGEVLAEKRKRHREQFQLFVCLGVVLLLVNMTVPTTGGSATTHIVRETNQ